MILWTIKLLSQLRKAVAGRRYPSQLAWAVAFGFLLGVVPHGNLLALAILVVVLSLKLNHAMAGLVTVLTTLLAWRLDPVTHLIGNFLLSQPDINRIARTAWTFPLVPWTDLNNTVVLGSLVMGTAALLPIFLATYPVFRLFKPGEDTVAADAPPTQPATSRVRVKEVLVDGSHRQVARPHRSQPSTRPMDVRVDAGGKVTGQRMTGEQAAPQEATDSLQRIDGAHSGQPAPPIETRIDVIRVKETTSPDGPSASSQGTTSDEEMDEALNYLLRQLRDSQARNVA